MAMELDCIPPVHSVQKISLDKIKNEALLLVKSKEHSEDKEVEESEDFTNFMVQYDVLPMWNCTKRDYLMKNWMRIDKNPYLKCKWDQFKRNVPDSPVIIKIYSSNKDESKKKPVRRMMLNGKLYNRKDVTKLNPIPFYPDPRK